MAIMRQNPMTPAGAAPGCPVDESFDVGVDTRTGVEDKDYQPPYRFTGKVDKLTVKLVPLNAAEQKLLQQKAQETRNKAQ